MLNFGGRWQEHEKDDKIGSRRRDNGGKKIFGRGLLSN